MKSLTNLGGTLTAIGESLAGGGFLAQLTQLMPNAPIPPSILTALWWLTLLGVVVGTVGKVLTARGAADNKDVQQISAAVQKLAPDSPLPTNPTPQPPTNTNAPV